MKETLCFLLLLLLAPSALAQEPVITWGPSIERDVAELQNLHIIGISGTDFYTVHQADGQATLERYDATNQRLWATALLPRTADGQPAEFHDVLLLEGKLQLLSTHRKNGVTTVYAQEITSTGNYRPTIRSVTSARTNGTLSVSISDDKNDVLIVLTDRPQQKLTASLFNASLSPRWTQTFSMSGVFRQSVVLTDGSSFILTESNDSAPITAAYHLYSLNARSGSIRDTPLGHQNYNFTQAMMAASGTDLVVAGLYASGAGTAEQQPEPSGNFFYRFSGDKNKRNLTSIIPFNQQFIRNYKSETNDFDRSKRLRNLELKEVETAGQGGTYVIGEVWFQENGNGQRLYNSHDLIITRLKEDGFLDYNTSIAKSQSGTSGNRFLYSFLSSLQSNNLFIVYQNMMRGEATAPKQGSLAQAATLTTILPDGTQQTTPLQQKPDSAESIQIRPAVSFPVSKREFIVLGSNSGSYRFGRLKF
ncbi:hypothetical protein [Pontibacter sp. SGAir0037]|uniref:hypothetical protein n=1 Tax=Pontibacter sp. SGAir0037 TaxID=2571030 RepID=UPI0010CD315B|nr:hypothetical protein [Pontibacter sp. SGAir0037]QCR23233.1 hypothetical protein C1N53_13375 [Pontibacter sp. SGAir0037]